MEWEQLNETRSLGINSSPRSLSWDFPSRRMDKNMPANMWHTGSIPGLGTFHIPWSK